MSKMAAKTTRADFEKIFPSLMEDVLNDARKFKVPQNALGWFSRVS
jgi:farnesyl diphosphate synthase